VDGVQLGIFNYAKTYRSGASIGIVNLVGDGVWRGDAWIDETGMSHLALVTGTPRIHTRLGFGLKSDPDHEVSAMDWEVAGHFPFRPTFLEAGLMSSIVDGSARNLGDATPEFIERLRLTAGLDLGPYVSVAAGVSWAVMILPEGDQPWVYGDWRRSDWGGDLLQWPGFHFSLRAGVY
jgi:hypothetical protein